MSLLKPINAASLVILLDSFHTGVYVRAWMLKTSDGSGICDNDPLYELVHGVIMIN